MAQKVGEGAAPKRPKSSEEPLGSDEEKEFAEKSKAESAVAEPPSEARVGPPEEPPPIESLFEDIVGGPEVAVPYSVSGAATVPKTSPSCVDLSRDITFRFSADS